ncbi:hypothetical protein [Metabacillus sp. RGM 3146]|uniref:hypothetical protein n=1 Tax=Metabacillus sp. RGM 3146 TaxID=3401092 RepID=UPI003B9DA890
MVNPMFIFAFLTTIAPILLFIAVLVFVVLFATRLTRRMENRAEQRLLIEKENSAFQKQQTEAIQELNRRLTNIEILLKEVE